MANETGSDRPDVFEGGIFRDTLKGLGGDDILKGLGADDTLEGGDGNDRLEGGDGDDTLEGGDGNDRLDDGSGDDILRGGPGNDIYILSFGVVEAGLGAQPDENSVIEQANAGIDTVLTTLNFTLGANFENLTLGILENVFATAGTGNSLANKIIGNLVANTIRGLGGNDTISGGDGDDTLFGDDGNDALKGENSNDILRGGSGLDNLRGGAGNDNLYGDNDNDILYGDAGDDQLKGKAGDDTLKGKAGNDLLDGGAGKDILEGGDGDDTYIVDSLSDVVREPGKSAIQGGQDTIRTALNNFTLGAGVENLILERVARTGTGNSLSNTITGNLGNNILNGEGGNDSLDGGTGDDILRGGNGNDILQGGEGVDRMEGGSGDDTYFAFVEDRVQEGANAGIDTIETSQNFTLGANFENLTLNVEGFQGRIGIGNNADNVMVLRTLQQGGADNSVLQGLGGNDTLEGDDGRDTLDGGDGDDQLLGGGGDIFVGGRGNDRLTAGARATIIYNNGDGTDVVERFSIVGESLLSILGVPFVDVATIGTNTILRRGDGIIGNADFATGDTLMTLVNVIGFTAATIGQNLDASNQAQFAFA